MGENQQYLMKSTFRLAEKSNVQLISCWTWAHSMGKGQGTQGTSLPFTHQTPPPSLDGKWCAAVLGCCCWSSWSSCRGRTRLATDRRLAFSHSGEKTRSRAAGFGLSGKRPTPPSLWLPLARTPDFKLNGFQKKLELQKCPIKLRKF